MYVFRYVIVYVQYVCMYVCVCMYVRVQAYILDITFCVFMLKGVSGITSTYIYAVIWEIFMLKKFA